MIEQGRHTTLAAKPDGLYARLCALQSNGRFVENAA